MVLFNTQTAKVNQLSHYLQKLSHYAAAFGADSKPFASLEQLYTLDGNVLEQCIKALEVRLTALSAIDVERQKKADLGDEILLFKEVLKQHDLHTKDDIYQYFEYGDIIEIYSRDFTQIYGNLQFMRFCSYDLFTLYTTPFFELYSRNHECDLQIRDIMEKCFHEFQSTQPFSVEPHFLKEIHQRNHKLFKVHPKWISPLANASGEIKACVLINHCVKYEVAAV